jgi:hypothetical protein
LTATSSRRRAKNLLEESALLERKEDISFMAKKKMYQSPKLVDFGSVAQLTTGGSGAPEQTNSGNGNCFKNQPGTCGGA